MSNKEKNAAIYAQVKELLKRVELSADNSINHFLFTYVGEDGTGDMICGGSEASFAAGFSFFAKNATVIRGAMSMAVCIIEEDPIIQIVLEGALAKNIQHAHEGCNCKTCTQRRERQKIKVASNPNIN